MRNPGKNIDFHECYRKIRCLHIAPNRKIFKIYFPLFNEKGLIYANPQDAVFLLELRFFTVIRKYSDNLNLDGKEIMKNRSIFFKNVACSLFLLSWLCSCAHFGGVDGKTAPEILKSYFPVDSKDEYVYRFRMNGRDIERTLYWREEERKGKPVYFLTDGKGYIKAYRFTSEGVQLAGMSVVRRSEPFYYSGDNTCLKAPPEPGTSWKINASLETEGARIKQTGEGRILGNERCEIEAGEFDALKILYTLTTEYTVIKTGEHSIITSQYAMWYGRELGLLKQSGSAYIEEEDKIVELERELIEIRSEEDKDND